METNDHNQNLIIRITEYGLKHQRFTLKELIRDLNLKSEEYSYVWNTITSLTQKHTDNPNHILVLAQEVYPPGQPAPKIDTDNSFYSILPTAFYNYVDYLEIKEARKQANVAKKQSMWAIGISVAAIIVSVMVEFLIYFLSNNS